MISIQQHKSFSFLFILNDDYELANFQDLQVFVGPYKAQYSDLSITRPADRIFKLELSSIQTGSYTGEVQMQVYLKDASIGIVPGAIIPLRFLQSIGIGSTLKNSGSDATINVNITESDIVMDINLQAIMKGPAGTGGLETVDLDAALNGDVIVHGKNATLKVIGFYNTTTEQMEIPTTFTSTYIDINSFTLNTNLGPAYAATPFSGKLLCIII